MIALQRRRRREVASAAEWHVLLESSPASELTDARLKAWLDQSPEHHAELACCDAAAALAPALAEDPELAGFYAEARALAAGARPGRARTRWGESVAVAAGLAAAAGCAAWLLWPRALGDTGDAALLPLIATTAPDDGSTAVTLAGGLVVDARSVAVLPFAVDETSVGEDAAARAASRTLATGLHASFVDQLGTVAGIYTLPVAAVEPFGRSDAAFTEIGATLGTRTLLSGRVALVDGRVTFAAALVDATDGRTLWTVRQERSIDELQALERDALRGVVGALIAPSETLVTANGRSDFDATLSLPPAALGAYQ